MDEAEFHARAFGSTTAPYYPSRRAVNMTKAFPVRTVWNTRSPVAGGPKSRTGAVLFLSSR